VIYLEQKYLYRRLKEVLPEGDGVEPIGKARIARPGRHATVVTYANGLSMSLAAADALAKDGLDVEVIDLRTLVPWDWETVVRSVARTGRVLVVHEATRTAGFGAEVAATIADLAFDRLDAPVRRLAALDTPVPADPALEAVHRPDATKVEAALRALLAY
jgi:pyruvate/2-oxoglutarate/acetoin dehydrogenase E1 component